MSNSRRPFGAGSAYDEGSSSAANDRGPELQRNKTKVNWSKWPKNQSLKSFAPPLTDEEILQRIDLPRLREGDEKFETPVDKDSPVPQLYRPNVSIHFFNEYGQVLGCFRKDKKSWQTVQGGIEDIDSSPNAVTLPTFKINGPHDPNLLSAAVREIAEEIGFDDLSAVGCEYVCELQPPSRSQLEAVLKRKLRPINQDTTDEIDIKFSNLMLKQLDLFEKDSSRFFKYEFPPGMGMKARSRGFVGQHQRHLLFYLPSDSIHRVNLLPDKAKYGQDVTQEFRAVAWMSPHQFIALCADFRQSTMAYLLTSEIFVKTIADFLSSEGRGGLRQLPPLAVGEETVKLVAPHVDVREKKNEAEKRPRSVEDKVETHERKQRSPTVK